MTGWVFLTVSAIPSPIWSASTSHLRPDFVIARSPQFATVVAEAKLFRAMTIDNALVMRLDHEIGTNRDGIPERSHHHEGDALGAPSPRGQAVTSIIPGWPKAVNLSQNVSRLRSTICYISGLTQNWT